MIYRLLAILAFVALLVGVVVLSGGERQVTAPVTVEALSDPGYSAKQARLVQTGPDGQPVYTVDAQEVQQKAGDSTVDLKQVLLGFKDSAGDRWSARAQHGELAQNSAIVKLDGDVHARGLLPGTSEPADITTQHLTVDINGQIVDSRDPVQVLMTGRTLEATGMVANLKEGHVQLESAVHGTFRR